MAVLSRSCDGCRYEGCGSPDCKTKGQASEGPGWAPLALCDLELVLITAMTSSNNKEHLHATQKDLLRHAGELLYLLVKSTLEIPVLLLQELH